MLLANHARLGMHLQTVHRHLGQSVRAPCRVRETVRVNDVVIRLDLLPHVIPDVPAHLGHILPHASLPPGQLARVPAGGHSAYGFGGRHTATLQLDQRASTFRAVWARPGLRENPLAFQHPADLLGLTQNLIRSKTDRYKAVNIRELLTPLLE